jgi:hypothetical protein
MKREKEHFDFDAFMNRLDSALSAARKTAMMADRHTDRALVRAARQALDQVREVREFMDEPLVWFKMEKGTTYRRDEDGRWRPQNRRPRRPPNV